MTHKQRAELAKKLELAARWLHEDAPTASADDCHAELMRLSDFIKDLADEV